MAYIQFGKNKIFIKIKLKIFQLIILREKYLKVGVILYFFILNPIFAPFVFSMYII